MNFITSHLKFLIDFSLSCSCLSSCQHPKTQCFWGETHFTSNIILNYCKHSPPTS